MSGSALVFSAGRWTALQAGEIVADTSAIRTLADGSLHFERDRETIDVEPNTEIRIEDRRGQRFTTVHEYFGAVAVEANRENVQHFAVKTPYLAAVVKGTIFAVSTQGKVSAVAVTRGKVGVTSALGGAHGDVVAGATATVSPKGLSMARGATGAGAAAAAAAAMSASSTASGAAAATVSSSAAAGLVASGAAVSGVAPALVSSHAAATPTAAAPTAPSAPATSAANANADSASGGNGASAETTQNRHGGGHHDFGGLGRHDLGGLAHHDFGGLGHLGIGGFGASANHISISLPLAHRGGAH